MGLNETPSANRIHIGFFGKRNSGKSSLMNAVSGQQLAVVSEVPGTTTDPVSKSMELLPIGPVLLIDTAGMDDEGKLGELRVEKTREVLRKTDIALIVVSGQTRVSEEERKLAGLLRERRIPFLVVINKSEEITDEQKAHWNAFCKEEKHLFVSAKYPDGKCGKEMPLADISTIEELKVSIGQLLAQNPFRQPLVSDLVCKGDVVILVTPIDAAAPKGRLILPQQQTIRELLEAGTLTMVVQPEELPEALDACREKPKLVVTDSQAFAKVSRMVPDDILLTSFSILFARYKGILWDAVEGAHMLDHLQDQDTVLICEGCSHHRQCGDIGTEKLPAWILKHTGKQIRFAWTSGTQFPEDVSGYRLVIHCGGCMLNDKEMGYRLGVAKRQQVPMTNYGTAIAHMNGILERSIRLQ